MIWNDACSDAFFMAFEVSLTWIACLNALEVSHDRELTLYRTLGIRSMWSWVY